MNVELTREDLAAMQEALIDALVYDNGGDPDVQCEALTKVRNALEGPPPADVASIRAWIDKLRGQYQSTGKFDLDS